MIILACAAGFCVYDLGFRAGTASTSGAGAPRAPPPAATLAGCVYQWNRARGWATGVIWLMRPEVTAPPR